MSTIDDEIVRIAERRQSLVTDEDLQLLGLSERSRRRRTASGRLRRLVRGVYATGAPPDEPRRRELALCLAYEAAVISHASAAAHWELRRAPKDKVEITVPYGVEPRAHFAVVHYSKHLPAHHLVEMIDGGRVTSVARTVFDLGGVLDRRGHLSVIDDARNKALCSDHELADMYAEMRRRGRRGSAAWTHVAELEARGERPTMSDLELELQQALIAGGLPPAVQQHRIVLPNRRSAFIDLAYPDCRLAIEVDHTMWHSGPSAVVKGNARDIGLALLDWERLHFTEHDIKSRLAFCVATVSAVRRLRAKSRAA